MGGQPRGVGSHWAAAASRVTEGQRGTLSSRSATEEQRGSGAQGQGGKGDKSSRSATEEQRGSGAQGQAGKGSESSRSATEEQRDSGARTREEGRQVQPKRHGGAARLFFFASSALVDRVQVARWQPRPCSGHRLPLSVTWRALPLMYGGSLRWLLGLPCGLSCPWPRAH